MNELRKVVVLIAIFTASKKSKNSYEMSIIQKRVSITNHDMRIT
ncbi:hypothetical protein [Flavobacterium sp. RS13.1]|jgi:hypothetical protein